MSKQFFVRRGEKRRHSLSYDEAFQRSITENSKDRM